MAHVSSRITALALALALAAGGCTLLDRDPSRATMTELLTGTYDPARIEGVDVGALRLSLGDTSTFCGAAARAPLRWTVDTVVPMQVWVDTYAAVVDMPEAVAPSAQHLLDFTEDRLRWSLTGQGERPTWDAETVAAAQALMDVAITTCPDLPMVVGFPGRSEFPLGWADMSEMEVVAHCESMARGLEEGVAEYQADHGRPPRHQMELDLPTVYYGTSDFHGIVTDEAGRPMVVPVPGGACDLD